MRVAVSVFVAGLGLASAAHAEQPYWICVDAQFNKSVQDHPCAYAPEAAPSGPVSVAPATEEKAAAPAKAAPRPKSAELDSTVWWTRQFARAQRAFEDRGGFEALWRNPWLHYGAGLLVLLLIARWWFREGLPRLRARRREREAGAQPDAYKQAFGQRLQAKPAAAPAPRLPEVQPARPTRWTPELLRTLTNAQFTQLCLRLWQLRGLRAEREPGGQGDAVILLRHPARSDILHGVVLAVTRRDEALGPGAVRELLGLMSHHGCAYGALMTPGEFNTEARNFVHGRSMELKGWMTLMTELDALPDDTRAALLVEVLSAARLATDAPREMLSS